jgi:hypothetical protein
MEYIKYFYLYSSEAFLGLWGGAYLYERTTPFGLRNDTQGPPQKRGG